MPRPSRRTLGFLAILSFCVGCTGGGCIGFGRTPMDQGPPIYARLPHHVPPSPDSPAFRFAMVHDIIHERYPKHGPAYYEERERLAREQMAVLPVDSEAAFAFTDDIAVGLHRRGRTDEAIALMRDKLKRQQALGLAEKEHYSSYANLAEFLFQSNVQAMLGGDVGARKLVQEGREFVLKSLEVNPNAHFGREAWQLVTIDAALSASEEPDLLRQCDLIGNRLDQKIEIPEGPFYPESQDDSHARFGRPYSSSWVVALYYVDEPRVSADEALEDPKKRAEFRGYIAQVGREVPFRPENQTERGKRAPFDEPALWLIGDWRQDGGPNPHSALCLGEIMLRVGQRYLAWSCYERASRLADRFSPRRELQGFLRGHCEERQAAIEWTLSPGEVAELRKKFESELNFGEAYQRDYQAYTEQKIQAGANINDPHFFDEFHAGRPPIASPVGPEEWYAGSKKRYSMNDKFRAFFVWGLLGGGGLLLLTSLIATRLSGPKPAGLNLREVSVADAHQPPDRVEPLRSDPADPS